MTATPSDAGLAPAPEPIFTVGGRRFRGAGPLSFERYNYVVTVLWDAGLDTADKVASSLQSTLARAGLSSVALAGFVVEVDKDGHTEPWSPASAAAAAAHFKVTTDLEAFSVMQGILISQINGFFGNGLASSLTSPASSDPSASGAKTTSPPSGTSEAPRSGRKTSASANATAATPSSAPSPTSSVT